ncbi:hypothetical protein ACJIZ3_016986 [Penstemon smallii]|uniref:Uncharacterized protein n=1 Tax=Penstemon smallii TaxID=265156 RepID=A0ABD3SU97_9LAMI
MALSGAICWQILGDYMSMNPTILVKFQEQGIQLVYLRNSENLTDKPLPIFPRQTHTSVKDEDIVIGSM